MLCPSQRCRTHRDIAVAWELAWLGWDSCWYHAIFMDPEASVYEQKL
jgi:hypothetical protein